MTAAIITVYALLLAAVAAQVVSEHSARGTRRYRLAVAVVWVLVAGAMVQVAVTWWLYL